jgi:hypothetical protein
MVLTIGAGIWEDSVRKYLNGFSDAIVPEPASPEQKVEAILAWMRAGPPRLEANHLAELSPHDPQDTLNYRQLLAVCGSATNAFLNLSRSAGLEARRLLLLTPERTTKHVVAEIYLNGRWIVVDATYRTIMKDAWGNLLTRKDLQNPRIFQEATSSIPGYVPAYSYERYAHVRLTALPFNASRVRRFLDWTFPSWEEHLDWSLLLERRSFLYLFLSITSMLFLMALRFFLGWIADRYLKVPRFHLRANLGRITSILLTPPEIK